MGVRAVLAAVCGVVALAFAPPADAAKLGLVPVSGGGEQLTYVADPGVIDVATLIGGSGSSFRIQATSGGIVAMPPCVKLDPVPPGTGETGECPATGVVSAVFDLGDENDHLDIFMPVQIPVTVAMGPGNDLVTARDNGPETITCGPGDDHVIVDVIDVVSPDCERVERATAGGGPPPDTDVWTRADHRPIGVSINGGATFTNDPYAVVTAYGPDLASETILSNDGGFQAPARFPATQITYPWRLADTGPERIPKTVYARFAGPGLDETRTFSDDIVLDQTRPVVKAATLRHGLLHVTARDATSGVRAMQWRTSRSASPSKFRPFSRTVRFTRHLPRFVRVRDGAHNASQWRAVSR